MDRQNVHGRTHKLNDVDVTVSALMWTNSVFFLFHSLIWLALISLTSPKHLIQQTKYTA